MKASRGVAGLGMCLLEWLDPSPYKESSVLRPVSGGLVMASALGPLMPRKGSYYSVISCWYCSVGTVCVIEKDMEAFRPVQRLPCVPLAQSHLRRLTKIAPNASAPTRKLRQQFHTYRKFCRAVRSRNVRRRSLGI